jgi:peptidoglycan/xylan/chitin deacetylase (PgdA/CDA1 family)
MYHAIADVPYTSLHDLFVRPAELLAQLEYLSKEGYQTITFEDLDNIGAFTKPVMLTFDDGYEDNYEILFPMLRQLNMKATIFVITGTFWSPNKLTGEQILEMSNSGLVSIQSHTVNHPNLTSLGAASLDAELRESKAAIEALTGKEVIAFCYPSGMNNSTVRAAAARYYEYAVTTADSIFRCGQNTIALSRVRIGRGFSISTFAALLG